MKNKLFANAVAFLLIISVLSCKKEPDECQGKGIADISNISAPARGAINQDVEILVKVVLSNGCIKFAGFSEVLENGNLVVSTNIKLDGCICTDIYSEPELKYIFKRAIAGNYKIIFKNAGSSDVEKVITIQ